MPRMPIVEGLKKYTSLQRSRFHMPGHQGKILHSQMKELQDNVYQWDITEVDGADNLQNPQGIIKEGMEELAKAMGAKESFFLVNGSTCGLLSVMWSLFQPGEKVLIQRNCHQSVFHAMELRQLNPRYVYPQIISELALPSHVTAEDIEQSLVKEPDLKGVVITSPSYFGICSDIEGISKVCKEFGVILIVDEAHGAHLNFSSSLPKSAVVAGADVSICSFHKTLVSLTQTAVLNLGEGIDQDQRDKICSSLRIFQTTSPSYLFLAAMDIARDFMVCHGHTRLRQLSDEIHKLADFVRTLDNIDLLQTKDLSCRAQLDWTRLTLYALENGENLMRQLRDEFSIEAEMHTHNHVVLITTVATDHKMFKDLYTALSYLDKKLRPANQHRIWTTYPKSKVVFPPYEVQRKLWGVKKINEAIGYVSAEGVVPYPPGVPIIYPGEEITQEIVETLETMEKTGLCILKDKTTKKDEIAVMVG